MTDHDLIQRLRDVNEENALIVRRRAADALEAAAARANQLEEALDWYAQDEHYQRSGPYVGASYSAVDADAGARAKTVLAGVPAEPATEEKCHCGRTAEPRDPDPWEGRMDGYCYDCALNRCDCYPDECPVRAPSSVSAGAGRVPADTIEKAVVDVLRDRLGITFGKDERDAAAAWEYVSCICREAMKVSRDPNYEKSGYAPRKAELARQVFALTYLALELRDAALAAVRTPKEDTVIDSRRYPMGEEGGSPEDFAVIDDLLRADRAASRVHDYLYDLNGVTRVEANAAIWEIHEVLRPLIDPSGRAWTTPGRTAEGGDDAAVQTPEEQT